MNTNNNQSEEVERIVEEFKRLPEPDIFTAYAPHIDWLRNILTTHGASEYARGKSEERERIIKIVTTSQDAFMSPLTEKRFIEALSQEDTLKE